MFSAKSNAVLFAVCCFFGMAFAQEVYDGYVLYDQGSNVYLINTNKEVVHTWQNLRQNPYGVYLNDEGNLIRPCKSDVPGIEYAVSFGSVQEIDKDGNALWTFTYKNDSLVGHHDIALMPNGNFLLIAYEEKTVEEARSVGFDTDSDILLEHIVEVQPPQNGQGEPQIVWKWHIWDHLTTGNEPELFNVGMKQSGGWGGGWGGGGMFGTNEWMHMNGIDYNPELDQIMFSSRYFSELYIIDHSTSIEEAAGHNGGNSGKGGDILYRWGKPENYGAQGTRWVHGALHCPMWVPPGYPGEGNITVFVNTTQSDNSAVYEIAPQKQGQYNYVQDGSVAPIWSYEDLSSQVMS
ncbi:MAG: aryl-sulfate sulfotransferase, partial [Chitinivibrionales bacterium]